jgi:hypothetical protein
MVQEDLNIILARTSNPRKMKDEVTVVENYKNVRVFWNWLKACFILKHAFD